MKRTAWLAAIAAVIAWGCGDDAQLPAVDGGGSGGFAGSPGGSGGSGGGGGGSGGTTVEPEPELAAVQIELGPDQMCGIHPCGTIPGGGTRLLVARLVDMEGEIRTDVKVHWSSSDTSVATVDDGLVTGVAKGHATITAEAGANKVRGTYAITVLPNQVLSIEIVEQDVVLAAGETKTLTAIAYDEDGVRLDDVTFFWGVGNSLIASVNETGTVTATGRGTTVVLVAADRGTATGWTKLTSTSGTEPHAPFALVDVVPGGCGIDAAGKAYCWGYNFFGEMGVDRQDPGHVHFPVPEAVHTDVRFRSMHKGRYKTCGGDTDGLPWCWGTNDNGQLGISTREEPIGGSAVPMPVAADEVAQLTLGGSHSCAISVEGDTYCWGFGAEGALGNGGTEAQWTPALIEGHTFTKITAGEYHTCALDEAGVAWCWGANFLGQLGNGAERDGVNLGELAENALEPARVLGDHVFVDIDATNHTCALTADGETWCWGNNQLGHIADPELGMEITTPVQVPGDVAFVRVEAGVFHTCGLTADGEAWCWGLNEYGQLGDGTLVPSRTPVRVAFDLPFVEIDADDNATCGVVQGGGAYCWGSSAFADLGGGFTPGLSTVPWPVIAPAPVPEE